MGFEEDLDQFEFLKYLRYFTESKFILFLTN